MYIRGPEVTLKPNSCFNVTNYEVVYKDKPQLKPDFVKVASNLTGFEVDT